MEQIFIDQAISAARKLWGRGNRPDSFKTKVPTGNPGESSLLSVHIYHHETFQMGARSFTADVRSLPDTPEQPGELLHRSRLHIPG